ATPVPAGSPTGRACCDPTDTVRSRAPHRCAGLGRSPSPFAARPDRASHPIRITFTRPPPHSRHARRRSADRVPGARRTDRPWTPGSRSQPSVPIEASRRESPETRTSAGLSARLNRHYSNWDRTTMPRRRAITDAQLEALLALPTAEPDLIRHYTLSPADLAVIARRRRPHNRLGFAIQLCALRQGRVSPARRPGSLTCTRGSRSRTGT